MTVGRANHSLAFWEALGLSPTHTPAATASFVGWSQLCVHIPHILAAFLLFFTQHLVAKVIFLIVVFFSLLHHRGNEETEGSVLS